VIVYILLVGSGVRGVFSTVDRARLAWPRAKKWRQRQTPDGLYEWWEESDSERTVRIQEWEVQT
jgi:hypothetical protein